MFLVGWDLMFKQMLITKPKTSSSTWSEKNLIHGRVMATISKISPQIFEMYFNYLAR